jgi:hypothetical protein
MYDIIIMAAIKDFEKIEFVYNSILKNLPKEYNKIYCFTPVESFGKIEGITYMLDSDVLKVDMSSVNFNPSWPSVLDNYVFAYIGTRRNISLTIPTALMTVNGGQRDGDIASLSVSHNLNVILV